MVRRFVVTLIACLLLGGVTLVAGEPDQGKGKKHKRASAASSDRAGSGAAVQVVFVAGDLAIIRSHYAPRARALPPGLQKKVARGGQLPPGWRKKFEAFPPAVEPRLRPLPAGYRRGVLDGHAVIYDDRTKVIVDVAVLF